MPHVSSVALAVALGVLTLHTSSTPTLVVGDAAARLTPDHLAAIARLVGEPIWLLTAGGQPLRSGEMSWSATAYVRPDRETPLLRAGRIVTLRNEARTESPDPALWSAGIVPANSARRWLQVPMDGRPMADVQGIDDANWPIAVDGQLNDEDLLSIVRFVRSGPTLTAASRHGWASTRLPPNRLIRSISLTPARRGGPQQSVGVALATASVAGCQDVLRLERSGTDWTATYTGGACG